MSAATRRSDTHEERYVHIKLEDHPRVTHATVFLRKEAGIWYAAIAMCVHGDQFSRRIGRQTARRKFFANLSATLAVGEEFDYAMAEKLAWGAAARLTSRI